MRQKSNSTPASSETLVRNIRRATRKHHAVEEQIRIVLDGLRGETSIAELCRREGIAESIYYSWFLDVLWSAPWRARPRGYLLDRSRHSFRRYWRGRRGDRRRRGS
jgi:hypothetical protein